jgi:radical SAM-linked protein
MRVRIRFVKLGKIRWTSHRDVARMWERAFRRVQLPLAYSAGFSPRPKVSFGLALPTGHESVAEYLDVELVTDAALAGDEGLDVRTLPGRLSAALPIGVEATAAELIAPGTPSLQEDVTSCTWRWAAAPMPTADPHWLMGEHGEEEFAARVAALLGEASVVITRTRKGVELTDDIRPGIGSLQLLGPVGPDPSPGVWLEAELACWPRTLRPSEVLVALDPGLEERHVRRMHQWILRDGARREPLTAAHPSGATDAPHAMERAS